MPAQAIPMIPSATGSDGVCLFWYGGDWVDAFAKGAFAEFCELEALLVVVFFTVVVLTEGVLDLMEAFEEVTFEEMFFSVDGTAGVFLVAMLEGVLGEIFWSFCGRLVLS